MIPLFGYPPTKQNSKGPIENLIPYSKNLERTEKKGKSTLLTNV